MQRCRIERPLTSKLANLVFLIVLHLFRFRLAPDGIRESDAKQRSADNGYRSSRQIDQQSRPARKNRQRIRDGKLPRDAVAVVRARSRKNHDQQETQFDFERRRRDRLFFRRYAAPLRQFHQVRFRTNYRYWPQGGATRFFPRANIS